MNIIRELVENLLMDKKHHFESLFAYNCTQRIIPLPSVQQIIQHNLKKELT